MFDTHGRIKCGTISVPDFQGSLSDWTGLLGYDCVETGKVPIELANGYNGYLPTEAQHALGGYETWRAKSSRLEVTAANVIQQTVLELLAELKQ